MACVCTLWCELFVFFVLSPQSKAVTFSPAPSRSTPYWRHWVAVSSVKWPNARIWPPTTWRPWRSFVMLKRPLRLRRRYIVVAHCYVRLIGGGGVQLCCNVFSLSVGQNVKESQLSQSPQPLKFLWEIPIPGSPVSGLWAALQRSQPNYHRQWFGNAAHWNSTNCKAGTSYRKWTSFLYLRPAATGILYAK